MRQVSLYFRPEMHLFAILANSTLRRDCDLLRQVSLSVLDQSVRQGALSIPSLFNAIGLFTVEELVETETARFIVACFYFCHDPVVSFLFLHPVRHRSGAGQAEILSAAERPEMAEVKQIKKIVPLIRV